MNKVINYNEATENNVNEYIPRMVSMKEASRATGLSFWAVRNMYLNNEVLYFKSGKKVYINLDDLCRILNTHA